MEHASTVFTLVIITLGLLLIASAVLTVSKRWHLPFTVSLVIVGLALSELHYLLPNYAHIFFQYPISADFILYVCLPTLIFESATKLDPKEVQLNLLPILTLAIPGLMLSTLLIGGIVAGLSSIPFLSALLLGAILSATDPVAVISIFQQLGAPKRLTVLVEGESLFNDATSIVLAKIIFAVVIAQMFSGHHALHGFLEFIREFFGGIAVGFLTSIVVSYVLGKVESDAAIEVSLTILLAYGSFILAQNVFHVSGVMSTVAAGLSMTLWGHTKISPSVVEYLEHFWEYMAYVINAIIFLLVGLTVQLHVLIDSLGLILLVALAMLISRAIVIYGLTPLLSRLPNTEPIDWRYQTVMYWGGLRGAIALAIVLSLSDFEYADLFIALVLGSVLFTLIVQGLTIEKLVNWLKLNIPPLADRLALNQSQLSAKQRALARIPELQKNGLFSANIAHQLSQTYQTDIRALEESLEELRKKELTPEEEKRLLYLQSYSTARKLYYEMFSAGHLAEGSYRELLAFNEAQIDKLRYAENIEKVEKLPRYESNFRKCLVDFLNRLPLLSMIARRMQARQVLTEYEVYWARQQGSNEVLVFLDERLSDAPKKSRLIEEVKMHFAKLKELTRKHLDNMAEYFPEFVTAMQERLAARLLLQTERKTILEFAHAGVIPGGVVETIEETFAHQLRQLREKPRKEIGVKPLELLSKVPFFKNLSQEAFQKIIPLLHERLIPTDTPIIKQGEMGESLFLITRGVVRVSKMENGKSTDLATLFAGDFFGEMALLHHQPRTATCKAVTPCVLYELRRQDFEKVKAATPGMQEALEATERERLGGD